MILMVNNKYRLTFVIIQGQKKVLRKLYKELLSFSIDEIRTKINQFEKGLFLVLI